MSERRLCGVPTVGILAFALLLLAAGAAFSQTDRGTIRGTVLDTTGAVIPGASITVTNAATGVTVDTISTAAGTYSVTALPSGVYNIQVQLQGFKTLLRPNVAVSAGNITGLDLTIELGAIGETLTVVGEAPLIQTESSATGSQIDARNFANLPLSAGGSRRANGYLALVPGYTVQGRNTNEWKDSLNGGQVSTKEMRLDGSTLATFEVRGDGRNITIAPDAIQELSVTTSGYAAEYGNTGGGVEQYVVKSGTNQLRGSLYDFTQNEVFDAKGFFNQRKPRHREFEYGGTLGGPVYISNVYDGRNKTFFFFNYNRYTRQGAHSTGIVSVPTAAWRNGDFSSLLSPSLPPAQRFIIYDPATTRPDPTNPARVIRDPFPGNIIPAHRIDPTAARLLAVYPLPNAPGDYNNYIGTIAPNENERTTYTVKVDHNVNSMHHLSGTYVDTYNPALNTGAGSTLPYPAGTSGLQNFWFKFVRVNHDWTIGPTMLNTVRFGFNRNTQEQGARTAGQPAFSPVPLKGMELAPYMQPGVSFGATQSLPSISRVTTARPSDSFTVSNSLAWTKGSHNMKFGFEWLLIGETYYQQQEPPPSLRFARNETACGTAGSTSCINAGQGGGQGMPGTVGNTGLEMASLLLGQVNSGTLPLLEPGFIPHLSNWQMAFYAQDDFKITPRLTLNYGLRADLFTPIFDKNNKYAVVNLDLPNPAAGNLPGAFIFAGRNGYGSKLPPADHNSLNWAPRLGLTYKITEKTVVRGGYGISFVPTIALSGNVYSLQLGTSAFRVDNTVASQDQLSPAYTLADGFPQSAIVLPPNLNPGLGVGTALPVNYWSKTADRPLYMQQWNVNVQRQISANVAIDVGYVGTKGTHLPVHTDVNQLDPKYLSLGPTLLNSSITAPAVVAAGFKSPYPGFTGTLGQSLRPYPQYLNMLLGAFGGSDTTGTSIYHALQVSVQKRFSQGFSAQGAYTWSQHLTDAPDFLPIQGPGNVNIYDRSMSQTYAPNHKPHVLAIGFNYELPLGPGKPLLNADGAMAKIFGGWHVNGLLRYQQGDRLGILAPQTNPTYGNIPRTADRVPGVPLRVTQTGKFNPYTDLWVNPDAFKVPTEPFGNQKFFPDDLFTPPYLNEDLSVGKNTRLTQRVNLLIRFELFNAFNRVRFQIPPVGCCGTSTMTLANPATFGKITTTDDPRGFFSQRQGQISAKLTF
jgi:hypothetical protein